MKRAGAVSIIAVFLLAVVGVSFAQNKARTEAPAAPPVPAGPAAPAAPAATPPVNPNAGGVQPNALPPPEIPLIQNAEGYHYDPTGRRDPFKPYGQSQTAFLPSVPTRDEPALPPEPLQMFEVSQLKLVGIVWEVKNPKAMIKDPLGKLHLIKKETKIGRNNGFVAAIREGEVVVVEPTIGENGMPTAITRVLNLTR